MKTLAVIGALALIAGLGFLCVHFFGFLAGCVIAALIAVLVAVVWAVLYFMPQWLG